MNVPKWRIAAGGAVLLLLAFFGARLTPLYLRNLKLQQFVEETTRRVENQTISDDRIRTIVLDKAASLNLPVQADNVHVKHTPDGVRIDVRYAVEIDLPLYTVNLHFYPGAGSR